MQERIEKVQQDLAKTIQIREENEFRNVDKGLKPVETTVTRTSVQGSMLGARQPHHITE